MGMTMPDIELAAPDTPEQPAPEAEAQNTELPEGEQPEAEETPEQAEVKKQSKFQRRLERQKTARIQAETESKLLRERVAELERRTAPQTEKAPPKREDYEDYEAYLDARTDYRADLKAEESRKTQEQAQQGKEKQSQAANDNAKIAQEWSKREAAFSKTAEDYEETVTAFVDEDLGRFSDLARRAIVESDVGPAVLYHLASDSDEAERIAALSPLKQVAALGRLEAKFEKSEDEPPAKATSKAPAPISPAKTAKAGGKDVSKMSIAELDAYARTQGSKWGGSLKR
jgi:hypothetical protein